MDDEEFFIFGLGEARLQKDPTWCVAVNAANDPLSPAHQVIGSGAIR